MRIRSGLSGASVSSYPAFSNDRMTAGLDRNISPTVPDCRLRIIHPRNVSQGLAIQLAKSSHLHPSTLATSADPRPVGPGYITLSYKCTRANLTLGLSEEGETGTLSHADSGGAHRHTNRFRTAHYSASDSRSGLRREPSPRVEVGAGLRHLRPGVSYP